MLGIFCRSLRYAIAIRIVNQRSIFKDTQAHVTNVHAIPSIHAYMHAFMVAYIHNYIIYIALNHYITLH